MELAEAAPGHVPAELIKDIDIYHLPGGETDAIAAWGRVAKDNPRIFFTPHYGGYWVVTGTRLIETVLNDASLYSSSCGPIIPPFPAGVPSFGPLMTDPPDHRFFRMPLNIVLSPPRVRELATRAREVVVERIDNFYRSGSCEFMHDLAMHVPIAIVMQIFGLPFSDREFLIPMVDVVTHSGDLARRGEAVRDIMIYADGWVRRREQEPGDDAISALIANRSGDRQATHEEVVATVTLLLLGGLDSVSHSMGAIMRHLAEHPEHQTFLAENPDQIPMALEELLRRHAITLTVRQLTRDEEIEGVLMKAGDRIIVPLPTAGLDEGVWTDPLTVDFSRHPKDTLNFGKGIHKCVGMNLARAELLALLEEWFRRIPSFSIKPGEKAVTTNGLTQGIHHLPLVWTVDSHPRSDKAGSQGIQQCPRSSS